MASEPLDLRALEEFFRAIPTPGRGAGKTTSANGLKLSALLREALGMIHCSGGPSAIVSCVDDLCPECTLLAKVTGWEAK